VFLYDCMTSCWDQNPQIRPSSDQLLDVMSPMKLQLVDFFAFNNYKINNIQCSCVVYTEQSNEEALWLAMNEQSRMTTLLVVKFQVQESKIISKVISVSKTLLHSCLILFLFPIANFFHWESYHTLSSTAVCLCCIRGFKGSYHSLTNI